MSDDGERYRRVSPPPPRFARGWCPKCRNWLEAQYVHGPVPDWLICHHCHFRVSAVSSGHYPLRGSVAATPIWEG